MEWVGSAADLLFLNLKLFFQSTFLRHALPPKRDTQLFFSPVSDHSSTSLYNLDHTPAVLPSMLPLPSPEQPRSPARANAPTNRSNAYRRKPKPVASKGVREPRKTSINILIPANRLSHTASKWI